MIQESHDLNENYRFFLCDKYRELKRQEAKLKKELDSLKAELIEAYGGTFEENGLVCSFVERQGSVDLKRLQIEQALSEEYINSLRRPSSKSFVIKASANY